MADELQSRLARGPLARFGKMIRRSRCHGLASLAQTWRARRRFAKAGTAVVVEEAP